MIYYIILGTICTLLVLANGVPINNIETISSNITKNQQKCPYMLDMIKQNHTLDILKECNKSSMAMISEMNQNTYNTPRCVIFYNAFLYCTTLSQIEMQTENRNNVNIPIEGICVMLQQLKQMDYSHASNKTFEYLKYQCERLCTDFSQNIYQLCKQAAFLVNNTRLSLVTQSANQNAKIVELINQQLKDSQKFINNTRQKPEDPSKQKILPHDVDTALSQKQAQVSKQNLSNSAIQQVNHVKGAQQKQQAQLMQESQKQLGDKAEKEVETNLRNVANPPAVENIHLLLDKNQPQMQKPQMQKPQGQKPQEQQPKEQQPQEQQPQEQQPQEQQLQERNGIKNPEQAHQEQNQKHQQVVEGKNEHGQQQQQQDLKNEGNEKSEHGHPKEEQHVLQPPDVPHNKEEQKQEPNEMDDVGEPGIEPVDDTTTFDEIDEQAEQEDVNDDVQIKQKPDKIDANNGESKAQRAPITNKPNKLEVEGSNENDQSYFFSYFMTICVVFVLCYVGYHNKQKILALILEGRKGRRPSRSRRPNSANYHKLDSNLEEAVTSACNKNTTHIIY